MIPTPEQVIPLIEAAVPDLRDALRAGIDYADDGQPDPETRDRWYWSHSARWRASQRLSAVPEPNGWLLVPGVPNSGIHLRFGDLHVARVLRSLGGTTPHPGSNRLRTAAWTGVQQERLNLAGDGTLPPLSLIVDWHEHQGEPEIHVGLPNGAWGYQGRPRLHWRVPMPEGGVSLEDLIFNPRPDTGTGLVELTIDPAEERGE